MWAMKCVLLWVLPNCTARDRSKVHSAAATRQPGLRRVALPPFSRPASHGLEERLVI